MTQPVTRHGPAVGRGGVRGPERANAVLMIANHGDRTIRRPEGRHLFIATDQTRFDQS